MEYIHQILNDDNSSITIKTISGYYTIDKEMSLEYKGKSILCIIGMGVIDSSCCGVGGCRYAGVPGYVIEWKKKNKSGKPVSEVEPIVDEESKKEISNILKDKESVTQINFW